MAYRISKWPFDKLGLKPGTLCRVKATCTFGAKTDSESHDIAFVDLKGGTYLMSLGFDEAPIDSKYATYDFRFLYGDKEVFLPILFRSELNEDSTEEEKVEAVRVILCSYVRPVAHGFHPNLVSVPVGPHIIGDCRYNDSEDNDEDF